MRLLYANQQENRFAISATIDDLIALIDLGYTIHGRSKEKPYIGKPLTARDLRFMDTVAMAENNFTTRCIVFEATYILLGGEIAAIISPPISEEKKSRDDNLFTMYLLALIWGEKPLTQAALKLIEDVKSWKQSN